MSEILNNYLRLFTRLKRGGTRYGLAPHKPILLLSVLQGFQNKLLDGPRIFITPELVSLFKLNWLSYVNTEHTAGFAMPFFHLKNESFWKLKAKVGYEAYLNSSESIKSFNKLNEAVDHAIIDDALAELMMDNYANQLLRVLILDTYFPDTKKNFEQGLQTNLFDDLEGKILHESPEEYRSEIKRLIERDDEEELFRRGGAFKREIPKIYNNTCCISGLRIAASLNVSMIDACHIVPFSESYDDTITNGIALCPNLHRAFDRGLISLSEKYCVVVSERFTENDSTYGLKTFSGKQILLPSISQYYPSLANLDWHRSNVFKWK